MNLLRRVCGIVLSCALGTAPVLGLFAIVGFVASPAHAGAKRKPSVLIVYAPTTPGTADVRTKLLSSGEFAQVDYFETSVASSLTTFKKYDAILLYNESVRFSPVGDTLLGNNLADYVDAGGGVVSMGCASTGAYMPEGRFYNDYTVLIRGNPSANPGSLHTPSIANQNHPILIGVNSLTVGNLSFRNQAATVGPGSAILVRWIDGIVLAAAGPRPGRVDLNFYPVSGSVIPESWNTSTDGVKLMVNSLLYVMRPRVLLVAAENGTHVNDVRSKLMTGDANGVGPVVGIVDTFAANMSTPTLAQLQEYDAVLVWSNLFFANSVGLGNVLADYVDLGGGVVVAASATTTTLQTARFGGRWATDAYEIISLGAGATTGTSAFSAGIANHPVTIGATGFQGGSLSLRPTSISVRPLGFRVALWADGKTLAAASTKFPNRLDLGMYPPSASVEPGLWPVASHGEKLLGAALLYVSKPYIACLSADAANSIDVRAKLAATRRFSGVLGIDASASIPTIFQLNPASAVLMWSNEKFMDRTTTGNVLANYIDAGGGSVSAIFGNTASPPPLSGRWDSDGYEIVPADSVGALQAGSVSFGNSLDTVHPISRFIRHFSGGVNWRLSAVPLLRGRTILEWTDGSMLASVHTFRKRADLGFFPPSNGIYANGWNQRTDGTWLMANALEWVSRSKPCPGDFNGDGIVDDADFSIFVGYYNTLDDPRGDLTGDGLTEDGDFSKFVGGYNNLVCP